MILINDKVLNVNRFPDGTPNLNGQKVFYDKNGKVYHEKKVIITWKYESDAEFLSLVFATRKLQVNNNKVILYMPYVPNARMDRVVENNDVFCMKYFGELINSLLFYKVIILDPHSSVAIASINNCIIASSTKMFDDVYNKISKEIESLKDNSELIVFYPDEGSMKRYSKYKNDYRYAFGVKDRDWETGKIKDLKILGIDSEKIKGNDIIIRDDICSMGGTFYYSAKKLREMGARNVYLFVTHCENAVEDGDFGEDHKNLMDSEMIDVLYTTNSIYDPCFLQRPNVFVFDAVYDDNIRKLFLK